VRELKVMTGWRWWWRTTKKCTIN